MNAGDLNTKVIADHIFSDDLPKKATRDGFGDALLELGEENPKVVVLSADLAESTRTLPFGQKYPERFFEVGVAEQNLVGIAAGLALDGKIPFAVSFGIFSPGLSWGQIRLSVCYSGANVKLGGSHTGLTVGADGATHQALEDIAITRCLPDMTVVCPADYYEIKKATKAAARWEGPVYIRFGREPTPIFTAEDAPFAIGQALVLREGLDVAIIACGVMVFRALQAAEQLAGEGISVRVINNHTIKPIDEAVLVAAACETGAIVTAEEHQVSGGMGSAVAELIVKKCPVPVEMVGVADTFGESGGASELLEKYGLTSSAIVKAAKKAVTRKNA